MRHTNRLQASVGAAGIAFTAAVAMTVCVVVAPRPVAAGEGSRGEFATAPRTVFAESHFGHGSIRGAVRPAKYGWQVRMPRGTWIDCVRSCSDTLRRQTVDFWENSNAQAVDKGRGYLHWEFNF